MAESRAQEAKIPFIPDQRSGPEELAGGSPIAMNVVIGELGTVTRRPGITDYMGRTQAASSDCIVGLYESNLAKLFAVRQVGALRRIVEVSATTERNWSESPGVYLPGTLRPIISETEDRVVAVGGDKTVQWDPDGGVVSNLGGDPPFGSHIVADSARLLLNDLTRFPWVDWFSDTAGASTGGYAAWAVALGPSTGSANSFSALPNREPCLALAGGGGQIYAWGRSRMQVWVPDGLFVYVPQTASELGIVAPYSLVKVDQNFAWLDQLRRFVLSDGRTHTPISEPIQTTLNDMETVSDCFGWRFLHGDIDALIWTFPTDGRTFVFQRGAGWSQWQGGGSPWTQFPVLSHVLRTSNNENIVGTTDGRIALLHPETTTDFGERFTSSVTTGFQNRDTSRAKACRAVRITMRRGESGASVEPVGFLSWRDDTGEFTPGIAVGFGRPSDRVCVVRLTSLGTYRRRQWKWTFSGEGQMTLADVSEEFEVLGS
jgi:hypothetical protein